MEAYTSFAQVYDELMDTIPYEEWADYVAELLQKYGKKAGDVIVDLGCGTGNMTMPLAELGYRMIGIDLSSDMLSIAQNKLAHSDDILYIQQDMTELELNGYVDAFVSLCDSMNYITDVSDLHQIFQRVAEYLSDDGVFIFDLKTPYFYKQILADHTFAEDREDVSFIWDNYYDEKEKINEYALSLFVVCDESEQDLYKKYTEYHYQRAYDLDEIKECIQKSGLYIEHIYNAFTNKEAESEVERWYFILKNII